jgi:hypothetical protein
MNLVEFGDWSPKTWSELSADDGEVPIDEQLGSLQSTVAGIGQGLMKVRVPSESLPSCLKQQLTQMRSLRVLRASLRYLRDKRTKHSKILN